MILRLKNCHVNLLSEEARRVYPIESCAMLFGELTEEEAYVRKVVVAANELHSTMRFKINPELVVKSFNDAKKEGLDFIGLFHSHPAPATPSTIDIRFMKLWGEAIWLILSSTDHKLAAYQMENEELKEIQIQIERNAVLLKRIVDSYMQKVSGIEVHCDRCLKTERWEGNVVLMIVDAAFTSIGLNYFAAVVPKVEEFSETFVRNGKINRLEDLVDTNIDELKKLWKNGRSWTTAKSIASYLSRIGDDKSALRNWAKNAELERWREDPIGRIKGVGLITFQYLRMMGGVDTIMPDKIVKKVINEILEQAGYSPLDDDIEFIKKAERIASNCGYRPVELCWMTWFMHSEMKRMKKYSNILSKL